MTVSPPGHEHYFEELAEVAARGRSPDPDVIGALRSRYDTDQLSALEKQLAIEKATWIARPGTAGSKTRMFRADAWT